jgi:type IV secretion system protein VirD4
MSGRGPDAPPWEVAFLVAAAGFGVACLAVVFWGGSAGLLFGDGWVSLPISDAPGVLTKLPGNLGDPAAAWPALLRRDLPGPAGFAAVLVLLLLLVAAPGAVVSSNLRRKRRHEPRPARWATSRDLKDLEVRGAAPHRVTLGRNGRNIVAAEARQSVLIVAPTQTGKTTGLAVPAILEWEGPVLATSIKSDLLRDTIAHRQEKGDVLVFDPLASTGYDRCSWTPLHHCGDWDGARRTSDRLSKAAQSATRSGFDADFWAQAGARFLAPLLLAAALSSRPISDVARWIDSEDHAEVLDVLESADHEAARNAVVAVWGADERLRSSLFLTASLALEAYKDPLVMACSGAADLTPTRLLDGANTGFLCAPVHEQARLRPLFATLVQEVVGEVYARASRTGEPIDPPLLLVLDEAANIAPLPDLDQLASSGAGQGLQLVTVFQDLAQVHQRWGAKADTIVNNHRAKLFGPGITCGRTLDYLRRILGDTELRQRSETSAERGRRSTTRSSTFRPLAPPNLLRERRDGSMLLIYGHLPPALIRLRRWFEDRHLRSLVRRPGAPE